MDYFVTVTNTPYHHWQIELLIESFKMLGLEKDLCVGLAKIERPAMVNYTRNLQAHERKFSYNVLLQENSLINFPYGLLLAIKNGFVKLPCTVIHADMVIAKPIPEPNENINISGDAFWPLAIRKDKVDLEKHIKRIEEQKTSLVKANGLSYMVSLDILPMGGVYTFKLLHDDYFERVVRWAIQLSGEWPQEHWPYVCRSAFMITTLEYLGGTLFRGAKEYESSMLDDRESNFIHYSKGLPPIFNKRMFTFEPPLGLATAANGPIELLAEQDFTTTTAYLQKVAKSYQSHK